MVGRCAAAHRVMLADSVLIVHDVCVCRFLNGVNGLVEPLRLRHVRRLDVLARVSTGRDVAASCA